MKSRVPLRLRQPGTPLQCLLQKGSRWKQEEPASHLPSGPTHAGAAPTQRATGLTRWSVGNVGLILNESVIGAQLICKVTGALPSNCNVCGSSVLPTPLFQL